MNHIGVFHGIYSLYILYFIYKSKTYRTMMIYCCRKDVFKENNSTTQLLPGSNLAISEQKLIFHETIEESTLKGEEIYVLLL